MGNFSRDPKMRLADSVAKHYVGIPLQQAVPLLDADWNELENLRRHQHERLGARFVGNGVPDGSDGFHILDVGDDNDFLIRKGALLLNGRLIVGDADVRYTQQPQPQPPQQPIPPLTTPNADQTSIIYLDAWEREVDAQEDPDLIDNRIGVETCLRLKSEWAVRTAAVASPQNLPAPAPGHDFYPLARVRRLANNPKITFVMLTDLRRLHLTLAAATKAPLELFGPGGIVTFTAEHFAQMLDLTAQAYFKVLDSDLFMRFNFAAPTALEAALVVTRFNQVTQTASAGALHARLRHFDYADGLKALQALYTVQRDLVTTVTPMCAAPARLSTQSLMSRLVQLLDSAPGTPGLKPPAFTTLDLPAAVTAQEEINRELANRMQLLPHGRIEIKLTSGPPTNTPIAANNTYQYNYLVTFMRTTPGPAQTETFDVLPSLIPPGWTAALVNNPLGRIELQTEQSQAVAVNVTIPPNPPVNSATLNLQVRSRANPTEMDTTNTEAAATVGQNPAPPPTVRAQLTSPALAEGATLNIGLGSPPNLNDTKSRMLTFQFVNDGADASFSVTLEFTEPAKFAPTSGGAAFAITGAGGSVNKDYIVQASAGAVNGPAGELRVTITKVGDPTVKATKTIKVAVNKP